MNHPDRTVRVLLVEDDEDDYLLTADLLASVPDTSYEVTWVANADQALDFIEAEEHDVVLLDLHLGARTGLEILQTVKGRIRTPCVLLTGEASPETDHAALAAGAVDYLVKGELDERVLERTIRYALGHARALRSVRESEERFRSVVEAATDGIALLDATGRIVTSNAAMEQVFGAEPAELDGLCFFDLVKTEGSALTELLANPEPGVNATNAEGSGRHRSGRHFPVEMSLSTWTDDEGSRFWSAIVRDVTERKQLADQLVHQAFHDPLTGLANRTLLRERVDKAIASLNRRQGSVALLFLDLDDFKRINDTFGHEVGDELLTSVASRLLGCVRGDEIVARLGGDEFAVCVDNLEDARGVLRLADRIVHAMSLAFNLRDKPLTATCSIGIAISNDPFSDADELLRHADVAMYAAKGRGKNRYEVFEDSMHGEIVERMHLETDLRHALATDDIDVEYQPVVQLGSLRIKGFEALARWRHPERGDISPAVFISVAEECGLIHKLGRRVLERAIGQGAAWQRAFSERPPVTISVNLSSRQLGDPGLVDFVGQLLDDTGLVPDTLALEITESVMLGDVDLAIGVLQKFRELGVRLALDDFGTGYSSLSYLHLLPLDVVKVDRSFIARVEEEDGAAMVNAISAIAGGLGLQLVAEGIETGGQRKFLTRAGYRYGQGFLFSKSLLPDDATALLQRDMDRPAVP